MISYVFAGLIVSDRDRAAAWYARLFGRPADMLPNNAEAAWQLTSQGSVYLLADPPSRGAVTIVVDDLDAELGQIATRGINPAPVETVPGAGRKCVFRDPDGNSVSFVELEPGVGG